MRLLLLLLFTSLAFAQYTEPPLDTVASDNILLAPSLEGLYNSSYATNSTVNLTLSSYSKPLYVSSSIEVLDLSPSMDNVSCVDGHLRVLIARGVDMDELIAIPSGGYPDFSCDRGWFEGSKEYAWRCDFDGDTCAEYINEQGVAYEELDLTLKFRNLSIQVPFTSTQISIPQEMREAMVSASGNDSLLVNISGNLEFYYEVNDRESGFGDCSSNLTNITTSVPFSLERSFRVGGEKKLFFLKSPLLREQWYRSNSFDMIVLSQCPLYYAEFFVNGNLTNNITMRMFTVVQGDYGISRIISNSTNTTASGWSESSDGVTNPVALQHDNDSFLYVYWINHSYEGIGENNLSLAIYDVNGIQEEFNETITSRALSHGGKHPEYGAPEGPIRPSIASPEQSLLRLDIALGLITLVLLVAFVNSWLLGGS